LLSIDFSINQLESSCQLNKEFISSTLFSSSAFFVFNNSASFSNLDFAASSSDFIFSSSAFNSSAFCFFLSFTHCIDSYSSHNRFFSIFEYRLSSLQSSLKIWIQKLRISILLPKSQVAIHLESSSSLHAAS